MRKAVVMQWLSSLVKEIISKLIIWFKNAKRKLSNLLDSVKDAIKDFTRNIKEHLIAATDTLLTTICNCNSYDME